MVEITLSKKDTKRRVTVIISQQVTEVKPLPPEASAQKARLMTLLGTDIPFTNLERQCFAEE